MSAFIQKLGLKFIPLAMGAAMATGVDAQGVSPYSPSLIGGYASSSDGSYVETLPKAIHTKYITEADTSHCDKLGIQIGPFRIAFRDTVNGCVMQASWDVADRVTHSLLNNKTKANDWVKAGLRPELAGKAHKCRHEAQGSVGQKIQYINLCLS